MKIISKILKESNEYEKFKSFYFKKIINIQEEFGQDYLDIDEYLDITKIKTTEIIGDVYLESNIKMWFDNIIIDGNFFAQNIGLTTLLGSPKKINGDCSFANNNLKTLEGCPEEIYGSFACLGNNLTTYKYFPKYIKGDVFIGNISKDILKEIKNNCIIQGKFRK